MGQKGVSMTKTISIIRAHIEDAEAILALQKRAYQSEAIIYNDQSLPPLVQTIESLNAEFVDCVILKAMDNQHMVGSVRMKLKNDICYIGRLIVDPNHQGLGIGTQLLQAAESFWNDAHSFELFTGNRSERNIQLYERHGYEIIRTEMMTSDFGLIFLQKHTLKDTHV